MDQHKTRLCGGELPMSAAGPGSVHEDLRHVHAVLDGCQLQTQHVPVTAEAVHRLPKGSQMCQSNLGQAALSLQTSGQLTAYYAGPKTHTRRAANLSSSL